MTERVGNTCMPRACVQEETKPSCMAHFHSRASLLPTLDSFSSPSCHTQVALSLFFFFGFSVPIVSWTADTLTPFANLRANSGQAAELHVDRQDMYTKK